MLFTPSSIAGRLQTNLTAADRDGTTVTASGTVNTMGSWSSLLTVDEPTYGITVLLSGVAVAATASLNALVDIGVGPDSSNVTVICPFLNAGHAGDAAAAHGLGKTHYFPIFIPDGTQVWGRAQANTASNTVQVAVWLHQRFKWIPPHLVSTVQAYGEDTANSRGTSVTPASGAFGTWTVLATASDLPHRLWTCSMDGLADTTIVNMNYLTQIGYGPSTSDVTIIGDYLFKMNANESIEGPFPSDPIYHEVADTSLDLMARCAAGGTEARGVTIYGMGP